MSPDLLRMLYAVVCPHAPHVDPAELADATAKGLVTEDRTALTDAGRKALTDGLQSIADGIAGVKATVQLVGGVLAVAVTLVDDYECPRTGPSAWMAVHRAFYPITRHMFRIDLV